MKLIFRAAIIISFFMLSYNHADAQLLAVTKDGQRVILFSNGTWKFESEIDSSQLKVVLPQTDPVVAVVPEIIPEPPKPKPKPPRVYSLECPDLVDMEKDITSDNNIKISRGLVIRREDSTAVFLVSMTKTKKSSLWWTTKIYGSPCIKADNKMILVMSDGTRYTITTDSKPNCNGEFRLNFGGLDGKDDILASLKVNTISSLRIYTATGYAEGAFDEENGKKWRAAINCIFK